jgi:PTS system D-glucosamine-specific IIC component
MITKDEYRKATGVGVAGGKAAAAAAAAAEDPKSATILRGVGGSANVEDIDCCATRLRLTLKDTSKVDQALLKTTGASGVVVKGSGIQVIYGPSVTIVKSNFEEYVDKIRSGQIQELTDDMLAPEAAPAAAPAEPAKPKMQDAVYAAHMNGRMLLMNEVEDETFAECMLGDGVAIEPSEGKLFSPCNGEVAMVFDTKHAVSINSEEGSEILLHIGIDTVQLGGKFYTAHVETGQTVKKGDLLVEFDMEAIKDAGYKVTTPMIICNTDDYSRIRPLKSGHVHAGDDLLSVEG